MINLISACISHYKLNDNAASKVVVDSQGFSNGTAQQNTSILHTTGKVGGALSFNGTTDGIDAGNSFLSTFQSDFTIALWVEPNDGQPFGTQVLFAKVGIEGDLYIWLQANGSLEVDYAVFLVGDLLIYTDPVFTNGQQEWHFLAMTVAQTTPTTGTIKIYFDGSLLAAQTGDMVMSSFANSENLSIGILGYSNPYKGLIDNVMIFSEALSIEEIAFLWNGGEGTELLYEETDIESILCLEILDDDTLAGFIGNHLYLKEAPQKATLPFIIYDQRTGDFHKTLQETIPLRKTTFQFTCWSNTLAGAIVIAEALKTLLNSVLGVYKDIRVEKVKPADEGDVGNLESNEKLKRRGRRLIYEVWYQKE